MRHARTIAVIALTGLLAVASAWAQATATWTGLAGPVAGNTYTFETAANWSGNVAPVNGDNLVFGDNGRNASDVVGDAMQRVQNGCKNIEGVSGGNR